jgi:hypothetical protein
MERAQFVYGLLVENRGPFISRLVGNGWLSLFPISAPRFCLMLVWLYQCCNITSPSSSVSSSKLIIRSFSLYVTEGKFSFLLLFLMLSRIVMSPKYSMKLLHAPWNRHHEHIHLADLIDQYGSPIDFPCKTCFFSATLCIVMDSKSLKCSTCVQNDCLYKKCVFSDKEWGSLWKEESHISSALTIRDFNLVLLQEEINKA